MTFLRICSYNMHGYKQGERLIKNNIENLTLYFYKSIGYIGFLNMLANIDNNYEFNAISFMSDNDIVLAGRPYGGLAALWKNEYTSNIKYLVCSPNKHVMNFLLKGVDVNICMSNVHLL